MGSWARYPYQTGGDVAKTVENPYTHTAGTGYPAPDGLSKLESVSGNLVFEMWVNRPYMRASASAVNDVHLCTASASERC